jgi:AAA domain
VNKSVVVMIMGEGAGSVGKRVRAWQSTYGPMPDDALRVLPRPVQAGDAAKWAVLVRACERLRAAIDPELGMFVIVDTQARATVGLDENSAEEMGTYVAAVTALKEVTGGCVMSVHHTTKAGTSTRGSGALDGAQDARLLMESRPGTLEGRLSVKKQKDLEEAGPIELRFRKVDVGRDADGEPIDSLVLLPDGAWNSGLFDDGSAHRVAQEEQREISPFAMRSETEEWTAKRCRKNAHNVRWALQALADTGQWYGLTKAELRKLVDEKRGGKKMDESTWADVVEVLLSQRYEDLVIKVQGAARWTVDPVTLAAEKVTGE